MPKIIPIVEGDGDVAAVPNLIRRILGERFQRYDWSVGHPKRAHSLAVLRRDLEKYILYAESESDCAGTLILLDLDDGCPMQEALALDISIRAIHHFLPVAIVFACKEYETWFLASIESLAGQYTLPAEISAPVDVEKIRGAKEWITDRMAPGRIYKETDHQPAMSAYMDLELAANRSRSFRRLISAIEDLLQANEN